MPSARKVTRWNGFEDDDAHLAAPPAFAPMPDSISNNDFDFSNSNNDMASNTPPTPNSSGPASSATTGQNLFGVPLYPTLPTGGSVFADNTPQKSKEEKQQDAAAFFNKVAVEAREKREETEASGGQNGGTFGQGLGLTGNSSQQQNNNQPASGNSLFGNSTTQPANQTTGGSSLFGGNQQSQPPQTGGLFGGTTANAQPQQTGSGLFGGLNNQQSSQPQQSGGLFGGSTSNQQPAGGLFGGSNAPQPNQPSGAGGIFGGGAGAQNSSNSGGLFGGGSTQPKPSVFAGAGSGLGNSASLGAGINMFAKPSQPASANPFGATLNQQAHTQPSLLSATQHSRLNQSAPFGRLSMGQSAAPSSTVGAVKVDFNNMHGTTRFDDCVDEVKAQLENIDKMIWHQEHYCRQIEAFCPKHSENIESIPPDVEYVKSKADDVEQALISDAQGVDAQRKNADKDFKDLERCHRIITNLNLPQSYQYSGSLSSVYGSQQNPQQAMLGPDGEQYDMDLIGNYFAPMVTDLQKTVNDYERTLSEIESHMRVMESSALAQAQQLAQQRNGMGGGGQMNGDDTVRELADTLRGFELSILGVASVVGECREGVNELVLGRLGGNL